MKFPRRFTIWIAVGLMTALLAALIGVNSRLSWRPVVVDLGTGPSSRPQYLSVAWRGNRLWFLTSLEGGTSRDVLPTQLRVARNWNRRKLSIMQTAFHDGDLVALNPVNADFARSDGENTDARIQIWRGSTLRRLFKERGYHSTYGIAEAGRPTTFSFSPDGKRFIANSEVFGMEDSTHAPGGFCTYGAVLLDAADGRQLARQSGVDGCFTDFAWAPDSKEVAGITADGWVFILNSSSGKLRLKFRAHQVFGGQIAWSPDGKTVVTATNPRLVQAPTGVGFASVGLFRMLTGSGTGTVSAGKRALTLRSNGDCTFDGRTERTIKRFDARTGQPIGAPLPLQTGAVDMAFSPDGRQLAVGEHELALVLNAQTLATERRLDMVQPTSPSPIQAPVCVAWSGDGATLATATSRGLMLWRVR